MRTYCLLAVLFFCTPSCFAQSSISLQGGLSQQWALGTSGPAMRFLSPPRSSATSLPWQDRIIEQEGNSFSAGTAAYLDLGYRISERIGVNLAGRYVFAPKEHSVVAAYADFPKGSATTLTRKANKPFFLEPGIRLYIELQKNVDALIRAGALIPIRYTVHATTLTMDSSSASYWQTDATLYSKFGLGMFGGFGVTAHLPKGIDVFLQSGFGLLSLTAKEERVNLVLAPGSTPYTHVLQPSDLVAEYVNTGEVNYNTPSSSPRQRLPYKLPFNYWSIDIGLGIGLGK